MPLYYYDSFKHAPVFMLPPYYLSSYPSKKKQQLFFIHFAFSLSISKKCCVVLTLHLPTMQTIQCNVRKKKKYAANGMVLHVLLTIKRMNGVIIVVVMSEKIGMNTNLEFNYFVIIILILVCISKSFLFGLHTTIFNLPRCLL